MGLKFLAPLNRGILYISFKHVAEGYVEVRDSLCEVQPRIAPLNIEKNHWYVHEQYFINYFRRK